MPMTSSQFPQLLETKFREVYEDTWNELPSMIDQVYGVDPSNSAWEEYFGVGSVPDIPAFNGKISYLSVAPGYETRIEPKEYAGGLIFERKFLDDKKYSVMMDNAAKLTKSAHRVREKHGAETFGYAFSSAFNFMYSEEGVSLCSSSHTTKSGASTSSGFDNAGTSALSKTSIQATWLAMRQFRDDIGQRIDVNPDTLIVPENLYFTALEAVGDSQTGAKSQLDPDSANNTINPIYNRFKVIPYRRLDDYDSNNWFMVDSSEMKRYLKWLERIAPETKTTIDFDTYQTKFGIYMRHGVGFTDWRWIYGHSVS